MNTLFSTISSRSPSFLTNVDSQSAPGGNTAESISLGSGSITTSTQGNVSVCQVESERHSFDSITNRISSISTFSSDGLSEYRIEKQSAETAQSNKATRQGWFERLTG